MTSHITVRRATTSDVQDVFQLVFKEPEPHIRKATQDEVEGLATGGALWIAREQLGRLVSTCYVKVPKATAESAPPAEYGGAYTDGDYRKRGIGTVLARTAIAHYFWDVDFSSGPGLLAHVHSENSKPRDVLRELGFRETRTIDVDPMTAGFEHMPATGGKIVGSVFEYEIKLLSRQLRLLADHLKTRLVTVAGHETMYAFELKSDDFSPENLEAEATTLEKKSH